MRRLAVLACVLAASPARAQPRGDNTSPPPPGAPNTVVPSRPMLTWFGVQVSDPPAVHLQLSTQAAVGSYVEGQTLVVHVEGVDLDSRQTWKKVDLTRFESMPIVSIEVSRGSAGADIRLEFKPGIVPTVAPAVNLGTDGFTYVLLDLSGAVVPASVTGAEPTTTDEPDAGPLVVEDRDLGELRTRQGLALDVSAGIGVQVFRFGGESQTDFGISGLNLSLGAWITDTSALVVRATSTTSFREDDDGSSVALTAVAFTAGVQHFASDEYFVGGGVGIGRALIDFESSDGNAFAFQVRGGMTFKPSQHGAYYVAAEVSPLYRDEAWLIGAAVQLGWQLY